MLQKLNVAVSHMTLLRLLHSIGSKFDVLVGDWPESFIPTLSSYVVDYVIYLLLLF